MIADKESALRAANEADLHAWRDFLDLSLELAVELGRTKLTARGDFGPRAKQHYQALALDRRRR
jgi:hypothetical protein